VSESLPLSGVKVLDLFWVLAGPGATRMLSDYGATVVHVESALRIDTLRTIGPFHDGVPDPNATGAFLSTNAGKLCLSLDLRRAEAREVVRDLVRWADVVTESFSAGVMESFGLHYEALRELNPELIMISSCLMGQSGPLSRFAGFGQLSSAMAAFYELTGWPDRAPAGPFGAYTDYIGVRYNAIAILAALEHRERTGHGQYIDMSQLEAALHFLGPALLDYTANGRVQHAAGNTDPVMAPHGVYPATGEDRWVAIAVRDDVEWDALCTLLGRADLADDARLASAAGRARHAEEIDAGIAAWTREREPSVAETALQAAGVPASAVLDMNDLYADPQLAHRGHFVEIPHPTHGSTTIEASRFRMSRTPARIPVDSPTFGAHSRQVLEEILGYGDDRIASLESSGILV
jgi:benzylsuccinate CoA-transferase BbsF subunit